MNDLTAVILTKDEEAVIADCLSSLEWCDKVLVVDCYSSDQTVEIARRKGARVVLRPFVNFADQRNAAIEMVESEWVLFVDADERVSPGLAGEIRLAIQDSAYDGWWIPRKNNLMGKWLEYGGFYPDYHLRLARKGKHHYDPKQIVHEIAQLNGKAGYLKNPLIHFWYQDYHEMVTTRSKYASYMAQIHYGQCIRPTYHLIAAPIYVFIKQLVLLKSYKDGMLGWLISTVWGYYKFVEYWKVWGLWLTAGKQNIIPKNMAPC